MSLALPVDPAVAERVRRASNVLDANTILLARHGFAAAELGDQMRQAAAHPRWGQLAGQTILGIAGEIRAAGDRPGPDAMQLRRIGLGLHQIVTDGAFTR